MTTPKAWNGGSPEAAAAAAAASRASRDGVRDRLASVHRAALPGLAPFAITAPFRDPSEPGWVYLPLEDVVILAETARAIAREAAPHVVYVLSVHHEYGAEEVRATLEHERLAEMVSDYAYGERAAKIRAALAEALSAPASSCAEGADLLDGWGGPQLHIVRLTGARNSTSSG